MNTFSTVAHRLAAIMFALGMLALGGCAAFEPPRPFTTEVEALADTIAEAGYESVAVGLIHSYLNDAHEKMIREVLAEAIEAGGSSLRDHRQATGELGYFQHAFRVYDREGQPCTTDGCTGTIARIVQSGRSTFFCPRCQR